MDHELVLTPLNDLCLNGLKNLLPSFPSPVAATDSDCKCDQMQAKSESNAQLSPTQANSSIGHSRKASSSSSSDCMGEYPSTVDTRVGVAGAGGRESFGDGSTLVPLSWQPSGANGNTGHHVGDGSSSSVTAGGVSAGGSGGSGGSGSSGSSSSSGDSGDGAVQTTATTTVLDNMTDQPPPLKRPRAAAAAAQGVADGSPKEEKSEGHEEDAPARANSSIVLLPSM